MFHLQMMYLPVKTFVCSSCQFHKYFTRKETHALVLMSFHHLVCAFVYDLGYYLFLPPFLQQLVTHSLQALGIPE